MDYHCKITLKAQEIDDLISGLREIEELLKQGFFSGTKDEDNEPLPYKYIFDMDNKEIREKLYYQMNNICEIK